jgi:serine protease Do
MMVEEVKSSSPETAQVLRRNRYILAALVVGLISGVVGGAMFVRYGAKYIPVDKKQILVEENSAVVDVVKQVSPSVVSIVSESKANDLFGLSQTVEGAGTGMIVTADGLIMTNKHVVSDTQASYNVYASDGKQYKAQVVARDPINDVAFIRIPAKGLRPVELGDSTGLKVGQAVVAIGNALGQFQNTATQGIISGLGRPIVAGGGNDSPESLENLVQTDAAINPGNSGGPLVNLEGQVIGMNTAVAGNGQNIGFAIPVNELKPLVDSVKSQNKIIRPYLGVQYVPITKDLATQNSLPTDQGAYLQAVAAGSPAAKAGLQKGDIITKVGSDTVSDSNSLTALIGRHKVGDSVELTISRDNKSQTIKVTFEAAPQQSP